MSNSRKRKKSDANQNELGRLIDEVESLVGGDEIDKQEDQNINHLLQTSASFLDPFEQVHFFKSGTKRPKPTEVATTSLIQQANNILASTKRIQQSFHSFRARDILQHQTLANRMKDLNDDPFFHPPVENNENFATTPAASSSPQLLQSLEDHTSLPINDSEAQGILDFPYYENFDRNYSPVGLVFDESSFQLDVNFTPPSEVFLNMGQTNSPVQSSLESQNNFDYEAPGIPSATDENLLQPEDYSNTTEELIFNATTNQSNENFSNTTEPLVAEQQIFDIPQFLFVGGDKNKKIFTWSETETLYKYKIGYTHKHFHLMQTYLDNLFNASNQLNSTPLFDYTNYALEIEVRLSLNNFLLLMNMPQTIIVPIDKSNPLYEKLVATLPESPKAKTSTPPKQPYIPARFSSYNKLGSITKSSLTTEALFNNIGRFYLNNPQFQANLSSQDSASLPSTNTPETFFQPPPSSPKASTSEAVNNTAMNNELNKQLAEWYKSTHIK